MKTNFFDAMRFWNVFGVCPPLPFSIGERIEVRGFSCKRDCEARTLTLPSPLGRERRQSSLGTLSAALSVILGLACMLSVRAQENPEIAPRAVPVNVGPNDVARFLAGMPVPEDSPLAPLTRDPAWQEHAAFFEKEFSKLNLLQLQKLHAWQETVPSGIATGDPCSVLHV